ncbi:MAG: VOC family protein [Betaproteobacteria bacterium]|jgi:glyoxylase I family protein
MTKDTQGRESDPRVTTNRAAAAIPIHGLHHYAYRCRDAEETRHFYEDILGLPLWHIIQSDYVPSTGEYCPYTHIFFRMSDGACVAFFDLGDDEAAQPSPNTPAWVNHLALRVDTVEHLERTKAELEKHGVEVIGVTDHHIFKSIYFFDPNGIRLELTAQVASEMRMLEESRHAHARLAQWTARKAQWRAERAAGRGPQALKPQVNDRPEVAARAAAKAG